MVLVVAVAVNRTVIVAAVVVMVVVVVPVVVLVVVAAGGRKGMGWRTSLTEGCRLPTGAGECLCKTNCVQVSNHSKGHHIQAQTALQTQRQ